MKLLMLFLALLPALAGAHEAGGKFFKPTKAEYDAHSDTIMAQQAAYSAANAAFKANHDLGDFLAAYNAALFPVQRAWLLNNKVYDDLEIKDGQVGVTLTAQSAAMAISTLHQGLVQCAGDPAHKAGPDGTDACAKKLQSILDAVNKQLGLGE